MVAAADITIEEPGRVERMLTVEAAAQRLAIGRTGLFALLRSGDLGSVQIGRCRRIPESMLLAYMRRIIERTPPAAIE